MKTAAAAACAAVVLGAFASLSAGNLAAPQRAQEASATGTQEGDPALAQQPGGAAAAAQPLPPTAEAAPWPAHHGDLDAHQLAHNLHKFMPGCT